MAGLWSVALKAALDSFEALGIDTAAICREAGIPRRALEDPDDRIPLEKTARIWPLAEAQRRVPNALGLRAGCVMGFGRLPALDFALVSAPTVFDGLSRVSTYWEFVTGGATGLVVRLDRAKDQVTMVLRGYTYPQLRDYAVASNVLRMRTVGTPPVRVTLAGPLVAPLREYTTCFACEVEGDASDSTLVLAPGAHRHAPPPIYLGLSALVEREAQRLVQLARQQHDPLASTRREITSLLGPEGASLDEVAKRLQLSRRQLQRRLAQEGTTFPKLVDEVRRSLAELHLSRRDVSVTEVGYLLGFSEPSAFSRAFKRWTGRSPAEFRAQS